ncbi:Gfo/Idh/MocA family protein [Streptomyces laurentii]|uniref:Gfo/Idh/MocA family protein n=1 Tax=Streptomyces laurentii TaxID=39478 RepID=UPI0036941186
MTAVRIGVLGCADIARRRMMPAMAAARGVELVAVASRDLAKARETADRFRCAPVRGYGELLERDDVDAVYVPLPAALHAEWARAALLAGKHVLAEKPLSTELDSTRELLELARERGLVLMENVMFVHHPQHRAVLDLVEDGAIGELRSFQSTFTIPALPDDDIRHRPELGGGALWDTGVYPVRAALHLLRRELDVVGATLSVSPGRQIDTAGAVLFQAEGEVSVQLSFGLDHAYRSSYELCGTTGRLVLDRAFTPPADHVPVLRWERETIVEYVELEPFDQVAATVAAFAGAVDAGMAGGVGDSLRQAVLLDGIRRAAEHSSSTQNRYAGMVI